MSVTRYRHIGSRIIETIDPNDGELVKASDYDALVSVCRELCDEMFCTGDFCDIECVTCEKRRDLRAKALTLLDGEKNEAKQ